MKILKIVILQFYWFVSIKYGNLGYIPLLAPGLFIGDYFLFHKTEKLGAKYLVFSLSLILSGLSMDKVINHFDILTWGNQLYPLELIGVWFIFPTYYYHFFQKFSKPLWLPFLAGAIFGPFAYYSGGNINPTLQLKTDPVSLVILGALWGTFFLLSVHAFFKFKITKL